MTQILLIHRRHDGERARQIVKVLYHLDLLVTCIDVNELANFNNDRPRLFRHRANTLVLLLVSDGGRDLDKIEAWVGEHAGDSHLALLAVGRDRPLRLPPVLAETMMIDLRSDTGVIERDRWRMLASFLDSQFGSHGLSDFIHAFRHRFEGYQHDELAQWVSRYPEHRLADAILQLRTGRELSRFCQSLTAGLDQPDVRRNRFAFSLPRLHVSGYVRSAAAAVLLLAAGAALTYAFFRFGAGREGDPTTPDTAAVEPVEPLTR